MEEKPGGAELERRDLWSSLSSLLEAPGYASNHKRDTPESLAELSAVMVHCG